MGAIAVETRAELIAKLDRIRAELKRLKSEGKTEENCEDVRVLEEQADEVMDVLDVEEIERILNDPNEEWIPLAQVAKKLGLS